MHDRVWVGTCAGPRDVLLIRSLFNAYDIPVVISGERHFALFPWYVGAFRTDVFVDAADAAALLADSRTGERPVPDHVGSPEDEDEIDRDHEIENRDHACDVRPIGWPPHPWSGVASDRWHQAGMALLFGVILGFGAAHFYYTRAWVRGVALALVQLSIFDIFGYSMHTLALVTSARLADAVGALWLSWSGRDQPAVSL